jgi:hypothetical protein
VRQFVDPDTGEVFYEEQILRRSDEIVKVFRPAGRNAKFVKFKASQKAKRRLRKLSLSEAGFLSKIAPYSTTGRQLARSEIVPMDLARIARIYKENVGI